MKIRKCITLLLLSSSIISCNKFVEIEPPAQRLESDKIFSNDQTALSALYGLYSMKGIASLGFINGGITLYSGLSADEIYNTAPSGDADPFVTNSLTPDHSNLNFRLWRAAYNNNNLFTANAIIEKTSLSKFISIALKQQIMGEAKTLRALDYFYLVNLFGDVPLVISTDLKSNSSMKRTSVEVIFNFLKTDLIEAKLLLSDTYPLNNRTRINKSGASAILARIYLYNEAWANAESEATSIINSGFYQLEEDLSNIFSPSSKETIWQLSRENLNTVDAATYIPSSTTARPIYGITNSLITSFELGDKRKDVWLGKNTSGGIDYYYPLKYKSRLATQPTEYYVVLRLAEQYLIRAEARVQQGNIIGAFEDLNTIRNRAGLPSILAGDKDFILNAIQSERRHELFMELGHRWFDLKRTGNANVVLGTLKPTYWNTTDKLYPIPQTEIDKNPFLVQNPGY